MKLPKMHPRFFAHAKQLAEACFARDEALHDIGHMIDVLAAEGAEMLLLYEPTLRYLMVKDWCYAMWHKNDIYLEPHEEIFLGEDTAAIEDELKKILQEMQKGRAELDREALLTLLGLDLADLPDLVLE